MCHTAEKMTTIHTHIETPPTARRIQRRPRHRIHAAVGRLIARMDAWWVSRTLCRRDIQLANGQRLTYVPQRRTRR